MPLLEEAYAEAAPLMESDPGHGGGHSGEILVPSAGSGVLPVWACDAMLMSRASVMSKQTNYHIKKVCALLLLLLVSSIAVVGPAFLASLLVAPISGATRDGATAGLQHPATRARLGRAFSTSASNSSAMSTVTAMDELSFVDLRTLKTTRTAFGGDNAQSETIGTALQEMRKAGAEMIDGPEYKAEERYRLAVNIYRGLPDELKKHEEIRAELFRVSRDAVALNNGGIELWIATSSSTNELFPDVLWEDEEFVLYAMLQVSCSKDEKTARECAGDESRRGEKSRLVRSIYAERVSKHLLQKSVNILQALFSLATGPTANVPDPENDWLCRFLPLWDTKEETWRPLDEGPMQMPVDVAERILLICPMVVAGLLAAVADPTNAAAKWRTGLTGELGVKTAEVELLKRDPRVARAVLPNLADGSLNADDFPAALFQGATGIQRDFVWDAMLAIDSGPRFRKVKKTEVARIAGFVLATPTGEGVRPPDPRSFWADAVKHAGKLYTYVPPDLQGDKQFALVAQSETIRTALQQQMRKAEALMIDGPANEAKERYRDAVDIYRGLPDELKKHEETRGQFLRISLLALHKLWDVSLEDLKDETLFPDPHALWSDESFVSAAMGALSRVSFENTKRSPTYALCEVRQVYAKVSNDLQESVDILEAFFRFGVPVDRDSVKMLHAVLPKFRTVHGAQTWVARHVGFDDYFAMPPEVAKRFFGVGQCANPDLAAVDIRAFAALGAQLDPASATEVPKHLRICPAVVAGFLAADPTTAATKWSTGLATGLGVTEEEAESLKADPRVAVFALLDLADRTIQTRDCPTALQDDPTTRDRVVWDAMLIIEKGPLDTREAKVSAVVNIVEQAMQLCGGETAKTADRAGFWLRAVGHHMELISFVLEDVFWLCAKPLLAFRAVSKVRPEPFPVDAMSTGVAGSLSRLACQPGEGFDFTPFLAGSASADHAPAVASLQRVRSNMAKKLVCANPRLVKPDRRNLLPKDLLGDDDFATFLENVANENPNACRGSVLVVTA